MTLEFDCPLAAVRTDRGVVNGVFQISFSRAKPSDGRPGAEARPFAPPFIAGPENRIAQAALSGFSADRETPFNPLVLHGESGTGKSHLVSGLIAEFRQRHPEAVVVLTTAADFARDYADAVERRATDEFRALHHEADLLVIEDLHRLTKKLPAQRELVQALDAIRRRGGQLVATSARSPASDGGLVDRLRSRLCSGLAVSLAIPGPAARLALLDRFATDRGIPLSGTAARVLADGLSLPAPQLQGALLSLSTSEGAASRPIEAAAARRFLADRKSGPPVELREIAKATARHFGLTAAALKSAGRQRGLAQARGVGLYLARQLTGHSLATIGLFFGGRDRATVQHACRRTERLLQSDRALHEAVAKFRKALTNE